MTHAIVLDHLGRPIDTTIPRKPQWGEVGGTRSAIGMLLDLYVWGETYSNPDDILRREAKGRDIYIYNDMEDRDARVAACLGTRRLAVLGLPMSIAPAGDDSKDIEIAEALKVILFESLQGFRAAVWDLLDAIAKGFSVAEILWGLDAEKRIVPARIVGRPQYRFRFDLDENLRILSHSDIAEGLLAPERKFLVFSFQARHGSRYGTSALRSVYWPYFFKKNIIKFWLVFADKFGGPTVWGKYPPGSQADYIQSLVDSLQKFSNQSVIATPSNAEVDLLEAQRSGTVNVYDTLTNFCNAEITIRILGQTASTEGTPGKLGNEGTQERVRQDILEYDCEAVAEVINHQLIPWIIDFNWGRQEQYPKFRFHHEPPQDLLREAQRDETLFVKLGLPVGTRFLYDKYRVPEPTDDETREQKLLSVPVAAGVSAFAETKLPKHITADNDALFNRARDTAQKHYGELTGKVLELAAKKKA